MSSKDGNAKTNSRKDLKFSDCDDDELVDIGDVVISINLDKKDWKIFSETDQKPVLVQM